MSSTYNGRRGVNMSAFIQSLNEVPPPEDSILRATTDFDTDLSLFSNTDFFDLDMGRYNEFNPDPTPQKDSATIQKESVVEFLRDDLGEIPNFDISGLDFVTATTISPNVFKQTPASSSSSKSTAVASTYNTISPSPSTTTTTTTTPASSTTSRPAKRKASSVAASAASPSESNMGDEVSRLAAEEDKRRRNTAASARFRVKKKERERQLEKTAREMTDLVSSLNARIQQLETENKWLKNLVMEKNDAVAPSSTITTTTTAATATTATAKDGDGDAGGKKLAELMPSPATTDC